ncbi:voltage-dependent anion channel-domain-containing protein [Xylariomycetidae sp. FL0641]|nr:voltage-dependent anion channel-domain-containing protein [Xylariomycetidae sp. FL0641]
MESEREKPDTPESSGLSNGTTTTAPGHEPGGVSAHEEQQQQQQQLRHDDEGARLTYFQRAMRITWAWFPCTMSTGSLASLLSQEPFTFAGLRVIGRVVYVADIALFLGFASLIALRFARRPANFFRSLHDPAECFFFGAFWVSVALILNCAAAYGVGGLGGAQDGGHWLVTALRVLFWAYFAAAMVLAVSQYHFIFQSERLDDAQAVPAWVLPAYPFLVSGPLAAQVAKAQPDPYAGQILIAGIAGQGLGWVLALLIYNVYFTRLIKGDLPDPSQRPGMYVSVGPAAYTCAGLIALGEQGRKQLPEHYLGVTSLDARDVWYCIAIPSGLFLWMVAIWFSGLSTLSVCRGIKDMRFVPQWWAFVFPNAGLALATTKIGKALGSKGIQGVASGMTIILCILWLICAGAHIHAIWTRQILWPGHDPGVDRIIAEATDEEQAKRKKSDDV